MNVVQANAVSDKLLDLRQCMFKGANLSGKVLSGALMSDADFSDTNMQEAVLTKVGRATNVCVCVYHLTACYAVRPGYQVLYWATNVGGKPGGGKGQSKQLLAR